MISIITPFYNEEHTIISFIETVLSRINDKNTIEEFILVNGESTDQSVKKIEERIKSYDWLLPIKLLQSKKSRAIQQNVWAITAIWEILFFLHADCLPEEWFETKILEWYHNWKQWWVCHFIRTPQRRRTRLIDILYNHTRSYRCRFWDSWIIVTKKLFNEIWWFDETMIIEEDHVFIMQLRKTKNFFLYPIQLHVSDRLFQKNGFVKTLLVYTAIHLLFLCGVKQKRLLYLLHCIKWVKN